MSNKEKINRMLMLFGVGAASITSTLALVPDNNPTGAIIAEITQERDVQGKKWVRDDGSLQVRISSVPVHFREAGMLREIDNGFVSNGLTRFKNTRNSFETNIPDIFTNGQIIKTGNKQISLIPLGANFAFPIFPETETDHGDFNMMTQKYDKNLARYVEAWNGVDVEYRAKYYGIKESIIVKNDTAPTSFRFHLDHIFPQSTFGVGGKMRFTDNIDTVIINELTAKDAKGRSVPITTSWNPPENILTLSFNPVLEITSTTTHRVAYPVTIDPSACVTNGAAQECRFVPQSGTETTSFDAWIDLASTAGQSFADARVDSANKTLTNNNDTASLVVNVDGTGHVPSRPAIARSWLNFGTSTVNMIPSGATINDHASTSIGLMISGVPLNVLGGIESYVAIMQATTSGANPLSVDVAAGDWKRITGLFSNLQLLATSSVLSLAANASNAGHDVATMANGEARNFRLNATGIANIAITGGTFATTTFGICDGYDCTNQAHTIAADTSSTVEFSSAEGADAPILDVNYTEAAVAVVPPPADVIFFSNWWNIIIRKAYAYF